MIVTAPAFTKCGGSCEAFIDSYRVRVCEMRRRGKRSRDRAGQFAKASGKSARHAVVCGKPRSEGRYVVSKCRGDSKMPTFEGEKSRSQSLRRMRRAKIFSSVFDKQQMWITDRRSWRSVLNFRRSWVQKSKHIHNFCFSPNLRRRCENAPERAAGAVKHNFEGVEH